MNLAAWDAAAWAAAGTWATFAVYVVIGVLILWQVKEARRLREAELRPFVVVDFDSTPGQSGIMLTISNFGRTLARQVRFRFEPALSSSIEKEHSERVSKARLLTEGIPTLAPGKSIAILFDFLTDRGDRPDVYQAYVSYEGERGRPYNETILLDLGIYRGFLEINRHDIHDVHGRLKEIRDILKRWSAGGEGLLVFSPEEARQRRAERLSDARAAHEEIVAALGDPQPTAETPPDSPAPPPAES